MFLLKNNLFLAAVRLSDSLKKVGKWANNFESFDIQILFFSIFIGLIPSVKFSIESLLLAETDFYEKKNNPVRSLRWSPTSPTITESFDFVSLRYSNS